MEVYAELTESHALEAIDFAQAAVYEAESAVLEALSASAAAEACLIIRPGVIADFALAAVPRLQDPNAPLVLVQSKLATANTTA